MAAIDRLDVATERLEALCRRWHVKELALFGSVLREDFRPASDVDVLVTFTEEARPTLLDLAALGEELEALLGRRVDLHTRRGVEGSRNPLRRRAILETAQVVYGAR